MSPPSTSFASCKEAIAYALSHRRGPQLRRSALGRSPSGTYRDPWDASLVRACLSAAGVAPDSHEERELGAWARGTGPKPIAIERRVRRALDDAGLLSRADTIERQTLVHVEWVDPDTGEPMRSIGSEPTEAAQ